MGRGAGRLLCMKDLKAVISNFLLWPFNRQEVFYSSLFFLTICFLSAAALMPISMTYGAKVRPSTRTSTLAQRTNLTTTATSATRKHSSSHASFFSSSKLVTRHRVQSGEA
ncbi:hypothetical protein E2C01_003339 [Portunus trituberculatus]|uniref:Uncharacterized protein n=1 Tax=Portunus trituberculatus TaxID=210409 RepID=A0A5B7CMK7_PORTR|nr:hypothetical protein [Portunus trituberculatus]